MAGIKRLYHNFSFPCPFIATMKKGLPPIIDHESKILILGTMPGERSIALQQYYGNKGNNFWKILFTVFQTPFSQVYEDRLRLLAAQHIALWNVLASCERVGSADHAIRNEQPNDLDWLHENYPGISHVFFESKAAEKYFRKHCIQRPGITYDILPSTSGLNAGIPYAEKLSLWKKLAQLKL